MKTAAPRLLPALIAVVVGFGPAAAAESPRQFEGPYHVTITPLERVRATVTSTFRFPGLDAQEWCARKWVAPSAPRGPATNRASATAGAGRQY